MLAGAPATNETLAVAVRAWAATVDETVAVETVLADVKVAM